VIGEVEACSPVACGQHAGSLRRPTTERGPCCSRARRNRGRLARSLDGSLEGNHLAGSCRASYPLGREVRVRSWPRSSDQMIGGHGAGPIGDEALVCVLASMSAAFWHTQIGRREGDSMDGCGRHNTADMPPTKNAHGRAGPLHSTSSELGGMHMGHSGLCTNGCGRMPFVVAVGGSLGILTT
jgi:hypothetical protein